MIVVVVGSVVLAGTPKNGVGIGMIRQHFTKDRNRSTRRSLR